jgi:hypothetical protein
MEPFELIELNKTDHQSTNSQIPITNSLSTNQLIN